MLPNWIIIGVPKALTSSLFRWLADHPQVCGSIEKETYYFVDPGSHMFRADRHVGTGGLKGYEALFPQGESVGNAVVEATPGYLYSETALRELPLLETRPSFIVVLREPVAQLRSLHLYFQQNWDWIPQDVGFAEFVRLVDCGKARFKGNELAEHALEYAWYPEYLRQWRDAVGKDRLVVLLFDDLVADSRGTMAKLAERMNIDPAFYETYEFPAENVSYVSRSRLLQQINIAIRGRLPQGRFYGAVRRLYRSLNTRKPPRGRSDPRVDAMLSRRYLPMLDELENEFGLDVGAWRAKLRTRIDAAPSPVESAGDTRPTEDRPSRVVAKAIEARR
jgi:hypothetical protein